MNKKIIIIITAIAFLSMPLILLNLKQEPITTSWSMEKKNMKAVPLQKLNRHIAIELDKGIIALSYTNHSKNDFKDVQIWVQELSSTNNDDFAIGAFMNAYPTQQIDSKTLIFDTSDVKKGETDRAKFFVVATKPGSITLRFIVKVGDKITSTTKPVKISAK